MSDRYISASLRRQVIERASGCCEYCRLSQDDKLFSFHVDHIISQKHNGMTILSNLCLSCQICNQAKGTDIAGADPETGLATFLYHPRQQAWGDHFVLVDGVIEGRTPEGRLTLRLLQFNRRDRVAERAALSALGRYPCSKPV